MAKSEIIKKLACGKVDTEIALKQLKLLLAEFPDQNLISWVNKELTGYTSDDETPLYRKVPCTLTGSIMNYNLCLRNIGIPLGTDAPAELIDFCRSIQFRESIGELRTLMHQKVVVKSFPPDFYPMIVRHSSMSMTAVLNAQVQVGGTAIQHIFSVVDNKLLDIFMLLEKEFGKLDDLDINFEGKSDEEIKGIEAKINLFIYNDNSVSIGDGNKIKDSIVAAASEIEGER